MAFGTGFMLLIMPIDDQMRAFLHGAPIVWVRPYVQPLWAGSLIVGGGFQLLTLRFPRLPQHIGAIICCLAAFAVSVMAFKAGLPLFAMLVLGLAAGNFYIAVMLRP